MGYNPTMVRGWNSCNAGGSDSGEVSAMRGNGLVKCAL